MKLVKCNKNTSMMLFLMEEFKRSYIILLGISGNATVFCVRVAHNCVQ
jgi:hypothetical protein